MNKPNEEVLNTPSAGEAPLSFEEKDRRIYYQSIVYEICNIMDGWDRKKPGHGIVCGTVEEPSRQVQEWLIEMLKCATRDCAMIANMVIKNNDAKQELAKMKDMLRDLEKDLELAEQENIMLNNDINNQSIALGGYNSQVTEAKHRQREAEIHWHEIAHEKQKENEVLRQELAQAKEEVSSTKEAMEHYKKGNETWEKVVKKLKENNEIKRLAILNLLERHEQGDHILNMDLIDEALHVPFKVPEKSPYVDMIEKGLFEIVKKKTEKNNGIKIFSEWVEGFRHEFKAGEAKWENAVILGHDAMREEIVKVRENVEWLEGQLKLEVEDTNKLEYKLAAESSRVAALEGKLEEERKRCLAIIAERPGPTAEAYDLVCKANNKKAEELKAIKERRINPAWLTAEYQFHDPFKLNNDFAIALKRVEELEGKLGEMRKAGDEMYRDINILCEHAVASQASWNEVKAALEPIKKEEKL